MPNAGNNPGINAKRFAALLAGFDTGNGSEEEALAKGRALRRMAADMGMRLVDVMELPDVKQAIDDQMRPVRQENPALRRALEQVLGLQNEVTERTRDARKLAEMLRRQEEKTEALSRELALSHRTGSRASSHSVRPAPARTAGVPGNEGWMVAVVAILALALLVAAIFGGHFHEGGNGNELGYGQGISASGVHQGGGVRALPEHGAVRRRVHRRGTSHRSR